MDRLYSHYKNLTQNYPDLEACLEDVQRAFELLRDSYRQGGKVLVCGNGGSAADSEHIVGELMKGYFSRRPLPTAAREELAKAFPDDWMYLAEHLQGALPAISLVSQTALITAFANDVDADLIFAQQVYGYGVAGDVLIAISTSGMAKNVIYALKVARARGLRTLGLTGRSGGRLPALCDVSIRTPVDVTPEIQQRHLAIYHVLCAMLEEEFFPG